MFEIGTVVRLIEDDIVTFLDDSFPFNDHIGYTRVGVKRELMGTLYLATGGAVYNSGIYHFLVDFRQKNCCGNLAKLGRQAPEAG